MARPGSVVIRRSEPVNRHTELRRLFQKVGKVVFEFLMCGRVPDFDRESDPEQMIDVPMRGGRGFQVVTDARAKTSGTKGAADVRIKPGNDVESAQAPDLQAFHL